MANYHVKVAVNNSKGNQLVKVFNFIAEVLEYCEIYKILYSLVKEGYTITVESGWKKPSKNTPLSFEKLCKAISKHRFYETRKITTLLAPVDKWEDMFDLDFRERIYINQFTADWGGTFFEIQLDSKCPITADFNAIRRKFEEWGLDLCKSKRESLWYSHNYLRLTVIHTLVRVSKRVRTIERKEEIKKIEL